MTDKEGESANVWSAILAGGSIGAGTHSVGRVIETIPRFVNPWLSGLLEYVPNAYTNDIVELSNDLSSVSLLSTTTGLVKLQIAVPPAEKLLLAETKVTLFLTSLTP